MNDNLEQLQVLRAERLAAAAAAHRDRRERIATACMAGMLADQTQNPTFTLLALSAVKCADALIAELDKEVKP